MNKLIQNLLVVSLVFVLSNVALAQTASKQKASLLIFGNSFSANSTNNLNALAKEGGKELMLLNMVKGGCSLQEHAAAVKAVETDPESAQAKFYAPGGTLKQFAGVKKINALEGVQAGPWDYVSIQQYSLLSDKAESYEPYAKELIDFIHAKMPNSEIVVHETWAYREDDPEFKNGYTSAKMYGALKANYSKLAADYNLKFLPIGDAFQAARQTPEWTYVPDPNYDFKNPPQGVLPDQKGSLNKGWIWSKPTANTATPDTAPTSDADAAKNTASKLTLDAHHANSAGEYLGACIWYEFLFNDDVRKLTVFAPKGVTPEQAASLRKIAHETMEKQKTKS